MIDLIALWFGRYLLAGVVFAASVNLVGKLRGVGLMTFDEFAATTICWPIIPPALMWIAYMKRRTGR